MYRFLIVVMFTNACIYAMNKPSYRIKPPYTRYEQLKSNVTASLMLQKIIETYPQLKPLDSQFLFQHGQHEVDKTIYIDVIGIEDKKLKYYFGYNLETQCLTKKDY